MATGTDIVLGSVPALWDELTRRVAAGGRFADLFGTARPDGLLLTAHLAGPAGLETRQALLPPGTASYPALTPRLGAAFWYEREIHDLSGVVPDGHPRLQPLIVAGSPGPLPSHVAGPGLFTIPHGPVRSGVLESIEYLVETPGEDIPHLDMRVFYKHRGVEARYAGMTIADGVLLAERTEGIATVAHTLAFCHAVERMAGAEVPWAAGLIRVVHAELERLACHLDVILRLADAAGLAVAAARFGWHKEQVLRLVSELCGSRFGRGVVVPGGVRAALALGPGDLLAAVGELDRRIGADLRVLTGTASFLDRLRRTGPLPPERAREHGALGPIAQSVHLLRQAADELAGPAGATSAGASAALRAPCEVVAGRDVGWAEAPQGEVLYDVSVSGGRITRCRARSASFHNLVLMHEVFAGDILTDFPFIEASFGLSVAGVAR
jgi:formate hydrogenlyase subunit 5